ncbi:MAG: hypothetical protein MJ238_06955 [Bacilli bacterium]|nr:hypothetical protein [Bacilli bacterium]
MKLWNIIFRGYRPTKSRNCTIPITPYRDGHYRITKHAVARMSNRKISRGELHTNLHSKAIKSKVKFDNNGRPSIKRITSNLIVSSINPRSRNVTSVWRINETRFKKIQNAKRRNKSHGK